MEYSRKSLQILAVYFLKKKKQKCGFIENKIWRFELLDEN